GKSHVVAKIRSRFSGLLMASICVLQAIAASVAGNELEVGSFRIAFDERGITGLANPQDPFGAQLIPSGQRIILTVRSRMEQESEWKEVRSPDRVHTNSSAAGELVYSSSPTDGSIVVTQTFRTEGSKLDWNIDLENRTNTPVEVGDLAISLPIAGPRGEEPKAIFERGFLRHQFISENGSFVYFIRANGAPPFLMVTVQPGTKLEYFSGGQ